MPDNKKIIGQVISVEPDPNNPDKQIATVLLFNPAFTPIPLSRWQRFKRWLRRKLGRDNWKDYYLEDTDGKLS
jgi:hypothetical protein